MQLPTKEQIEKSRLISPEYKKELIAAIEANEAEIQKRARAGKIVIFIIIAISIFLFALFS